MQKNERLDTPSEIEEPEKTYSIIDIYGNESRLGINYELDETNLLKEVNESDFKSIDDNSPQRSY